MANQEKRSGYSSMEKQVEANKRWRDKNREHANYIGARGAARSFIRRKATLEDLEELRGLILEREQQLKSGDA